MRIYGDLNSGNCLKVKYTADYLGLTYTWVPIDIMKDEAKTPAFLAMNDMAQVPVVELEDGRFLAQSNAILRYLARGTRLLPEDAYRAAKVDEVLFWEQYNHEPYVAVCRFHMVYLGKPASALDPEKVKRGNDALDFMEQRLIKQARVHENFFVSDDLTIADIALLAYTRLAGQGGFDLSMRKALTEWIRRCEETLQLGSLLAV